MEDNECFLVVDIFIFSCGSFCFGCWVCILVDSDKFMLVMI